MKLFFVAWLTFHEARHRPSGVQAKRDAVSLLVDGMPLAGDEWHQIGAEAGRPLEAMAPPAVCEPLDGGP